MQVALGILAPLPFVRHGCRLADSLCWSGRLDFLHAGGPERPWQLLKMFDMSQVFHLTNLAYTWSAGRRCSAFIAGCEGCLLGFGQMHQQVLQHRGVLRRSSQCDMSIGLVSQTELCERRFPHMLCCLAEHLSRGSCCVRCKLPGSKWFDFGLSRWIVLPKSTTRSCKWFAHGYGWQMCSFRWCAFFAAWMAAVTFALRMDESFCLEMRVFP